MQHEIRKTTEEPVRSKAYTIPYAMKKGLREEIEKMLKIGVIRESFSTHASPIVDVK